MLLPAGLWDPVFMSEGAPNTPSTSAAKRAPIHSPAVPEQRILFEYHHGRVVPGLASGDTHENARECKLSFAADDESALHAVV